MAKPTIIDYFRNFTFVVFVCSIVAVFLGYYDGIILAVPYIVMDMFSILHRLLRFRTKQIDAAGSDRQLKYTGYFIPRHMIDMKFVAFFRRISLALSIGAIIKTFLGNSAFLWILGVLIILNVVTFIKAWYIFRTKWPGSYSTFTIYGKHIASDFSYPAKCVSNLSEHTPGAGLQFIITILVIILTVGFVLFV